MYGLVHPAAETGCEIATVETVIKTAKRMAGVKRLGLNWRAIMGGLARTNVILDNYEPSLLSGPRGLNSSQIPEVALFQTKGALAMTDLGTKRVQGTINYIRNPVPPGGVPLTFVTEQDELSTMETLPGIPMWIEDLRGQETSLDREGFALIPHKSGVENFHLIEEDAATDKLYSDEIAALVKKLTGASHVFMQGGGKKRYGPKATDQLVGLTNALPALYPHGDTIDKSALELAQRILDYVPGLSLDGRRWAHYNIWRPITPPPQDYPLALCDTRTISPADRETVIAHTVTRTMGEMKFETAGYMHNPSHRWCYFSNMTPDEVLVFITHDSDPTRPHQVAHTAFLDPTCPPNTPTRASVEMRALVLFE